MAALTALQQTFLGKFDAYLNATIIDVDMQSFKELIVARGWFGNRVPKIIQNIEERVGAWKGKHVEKLEGAFLEKRFEYGQEEAEKIIKH